MIEPKQLIEQQKAFFNSGKTRDVPFIKSTLIRLKKSILANEEAIFEALHKDFKKSKFEVYFSEIGILISEIDMTLKNLNAWTKPKKVRAASH